MFNEKENLLSCWWDSEGKQNSTGSFNLKAEGGLFVLEVSEVILGILKPFLG